MVLHLKEPPAHIGKAAEARDKVHYMHKQMQEVEDTIAGLQAENGVGRPLKSLSLWFDLAPHGWA